MKQSCHRFGVLGALVSLLIACGGGGGGSSPSAPPPTPPAPIATSLTPGAASISIASTALSYTDPTSGSYRWVKNTSLSSNGKLVLDLVTQSTDLISGVAFSITTNSSRASWTKVNTDDSFLIQNGTVFNIGSTIPVIYSSTSSTGTSLTLKGVVAQKGSTGITVNGASAVLARIAMSLNNSGGEQTSTTLLPIFSNGTGVITPGDLSVTSGIPVTVSPTTTTTYTLTVENSAGTRATTTATVNVITAISLTQNKAQVNVQGTNSPVNITTTFGGLRLN